MNDVFVIRTLEMAETVAFFEQLGLTFVQEKHGSGPIHFACEANGKVFEIYPSKKSSPHLRFMNNT